MNTDHGLICGELDRCVRQGAANFSQNLAGNQANAFCFNVSCDDLAGAGLVIEACDADLTSRSTVNFIEKAPFTELES